MNTFSPNFMQPYCTIFIVTSMWIYHSSIVFLSLFISITVFFFFLPQRTGGDSASKGQKRFKSTCKNGRNNENGPLKSYGEIRQQMATHAKIHKTATYKYLFFF